MSEQISKQELTTHSLESTPQASFLSAQLPPVYGTRGVTEIDTSPPLLGEHTSLSLPGEHTALSLPGEHTALSLPGEHTSMSLPGEDTSLSLPGEHTSL